MPVGYRLVPSQRLVVLDYVDPVTITDWTKTLEAVFRDPAYEPGFNLLGDRRAATPPTRAFADGIAMFVRKYRERFGGARVAILVSDVAGFGMARMQEMLNESATLETRAFTSEAEAYAWLGVSGPDSSGALT